MHARAILAFSAAVVGILPTGCRDTRQDPAICGCVPGNSSRVRAPDEAAPMDGEALLRKLRQHRRLVEEHRNPRDIKVFDDELRYQILDFCQPCAAWVGERLTMESMFPLQHLDDAVGAVCMGLVLRDGSIARGEAHPRPCQ